MLTNKKVQQNKVGLEYLYILPLAINNVNRLLLLLNVKTTHITQFFLHTCCSVYFYPCHPKLYVGGSIDFSHTLEMTNSQKTTHFTQKINLYIFYRISKNPFMNR